MSQRSRKAALTSVQGEDGKVGKTRLRDRGHNQENQLIARPPVVSKSRSMTIFD